MECKSANLNLMVWEIKEGYLTVDLNGVGIVLLLPDGVYAHRQ
jgi:hypothetical protein